MFKHRSYKKELLDEPITEKADLFRNLLELEFINRYLGGHKISIDGIASIITSSSQSLHVADIGCGGGDSLKAMVRWAQYKGYNLRFTGVDLLADCITYSKQNCIQYPQISFLQSDFRELFNETGKPDIVHASLFCHHFREQELIDFIRLCNHNEAILLINDLERNPLAYYSIKFLTFLFSKSKLVKNDAPLSVLRGFKKKEWRAILHDAGAKNYVLKSKWAFRHLIIIYPNGSKDL
jgi:2-polyprenyl-3-methyl-5-hydroxy-6-metoxy-1,4-benzoquinol methylase